MVINKREFFPDQQLLGKIEGRFVTIRMHADAQKTARTSKEPMEGMFRLYLFISRLKTFTATPHTQAEPGKICDCPESLPLIPP
jgi:hypothetical protein